MQIYSSEINSSANKVYHKIFLVTQPTSHICSRQTNKKMHAHTCVCGFKCAHFHSTTHDSMIIISFALAFHRRWMIERMCAYVPVYVWTCQMRDFHSVENMFCRSKIFSYKHHVNATNVTSESRDAMKKGEQKYSLQCDKTYIVCEKYSSSCTSILNIIEWEIYFQFIWKSIAKNIHHFDELNCVECFWPEEREREETTCCCQKWNFLCLQIRGCACGLKKKIDSFRVKRKHSNMPKTNYKIKN